jgi:ATP-dependent HslUV protease subunit HslV
MDSIRSTTIIGLVHKGQAAIAGDGQVSLGDTIIKEKATKIRLLYDDQVLAGFAGTSADAFTLFERFESKLDEYSGNLNRAAVELAKDWRTDRVLRRLEALLAVLDRSRALLISGNGDVIEPDDGILTIGSGGPYAQAAARALVKYSKLKPAELVRESIEIAATICLFTNNNIQVLELPPEKKTQRKNG